MRFDDLDKKMRLYETSHDKFILPNLYVIARLDGRGFTKLTKEQHDFKRPFDSRFRDLMVDATSHLFHVGFRVIYAYTQSDEISLLFHLEEDSFNRKERKFNSILASEVSSKFSLGLGAVASFDCRLSLLPNQSEVVDYFRWRQEDAKRNALNAYCYWHLRDIGTKPDKAAEMLSGLSIADKNEFLFKERNLNFNDIDSWQKRGIGIYWEEYDKDGFNPMTKSSVTTKRNRLKVDYELSLKDEYSKFILDILSS